jgi:hypothetical protein
MLKPIDIGSKRQMFLDDHVIDTLDGVARRYHRPVRLVDRPVLGARTAWEKNGLGPFLFGGTVVHDEEDAVFKMWYRLDGPLERAPEGMREVVAEDGTVSRRNWVEQPGLWKAAYATSTDGLNWERPLLGVAEYDGSTANNILPVGIGDKAIIRRPALVKDYDESDPSRKYKMAYVDQVKGKWSLEKAYSPDGVNWEMGVGEPSYFEQPTVPHGALFGWDPRHEMWVHYSKKLGKKRIDVDGREVGGLQAICRSTSSDFERWGDARDVIVADPSDPQMWSPGSHAILSAMLYTDDLYIGVSDTSPAQSPEDVPSEVRDIVGARRQQHVTELYFSRDGIDWTRAAPFFEFLQPGLWGAWDSESVVCSKPLVKDDQIYFYYSGSNLSCDAHIPDHPQRHLLGTVANGVRFGYSIGVAAMRLDGFVSIDGDEPGGTLTTKPLVFTGDRLVVNARVPETAHPHAQNRPADFGLLRVEVLDDRGQALPGFAVADCASFAGNEVRHTVTWRNGADIGRFAGSPVRFRFHLKNAALYSFHTRGRLEPEQLHSTSEPGSRGRPS